MKVTYMITIFDWNVGVVAMNDRIVIVFDRETDDEIEDPFELV